MATDPPTIAHRKRCRFHGWRPLTTAAQTREIDSNNPESNLISGRIDGGKLARWATRPINRGPLRRLNELRPFFFAPPFRKSINKGFDDVQLDVVVQFDGAWKFVLACGSVGIKHCSLMRSWRVTVLKNTCLFTKHKGCNKLDSPMVISVPSQRLYKISAFKLCSIVD